MPAEDAQLELTQRTGAKWTGRTRGGELGNRIFVSLVRFVGLRAAYALLVPVAFYFVFFAPAAMRASTAYRERMARLLGKPGLKGFVAGYRHFFSFGRILLDRVAVFAGDDARFHFDMEGEEHLRDAVAAGKGLLLVSAHCGNWEIAAKLLRRIEAPVNIVLYQAEEDYARRFFSKAGNPVNIIRIDGTADASLAMLSALNRGEIVAMHGDRSLNARPEAVVTLPFLGAPAKFPIGPYAVAASSGAPLIHTFAMREGLYHYRFKAYPPEYLQFEDRASRRARLEAWAGLFASRLEEVLRRYPLQWHNFYDFWA